MQAAAARVFSRRSEVRWKPALAEAFVFAEPSADAVSRSGIVRLEGEKPSWIEQTVRELNDLLTLPENWDGYGAQPIDAEAVYKAASILLAVMSLGSPAPSVVPLTDGGVQLEWHRSGKHLEIEIVPNEGAAFDCYADNVQIAEGALPDSSDQLRLIIATLA